MADITYPFDPYGTNPLCKITGEIQTITAVNFREQHFIVPRFAPFFEEGFILQFKDTQNNTVNLVKNVDYWFTMKFLDASRSCAKPIYGSITFLNRELAGTLLLTYQTLGGDWNVDEQEIARIMAETMVNPFSTSWDNIVGLPYKFPVIEHDYDVIDMVGMTEVVQAIDRITNAIYETAGGGGGGGGGDGALTAHINNKNNPHLVTAAQVGLGNVPNYAMSTPAEWTAGTSSTLFISPLGVKTMIDAKTYTKANVGLGNVDNYATATLTQAQTGTATNLFVTPAGASVNSAKAVADHVAQQNPHPNYVGVFAQSFTTAQQTQARANLGINSAIDGVVAPAIDAAIDAHKADPSAHIDDYLAFRVNQTLTTPQLTTVRGNLQMDTYMASAVPPYVSSAITAHMANANAHANDYVGFNIAQTLTAPQQSQVQANIGTAAFVQPIINVAVSSVTTGLTQSIEELQGVAITGGLISRQVAIAQTDAVLTALKTSNSLLRIYDTSSGSPLIWFRFDQGAAWQSSDVNNGTIVFNKLYHTTLTGTTHYLAAWGDLVLIANNNAVIDPIDNDVTVTTNGDILFD